MSDKTYTVETYDAVGRFAAPMMAKPGLTAEQATVIASAFLYVAVEIFTATTSKEGAALPLFKAANNLIDPEPR